MQDINQNMILRQTNLETAAFSTRKNDLYFLILISLSINFKYSVQILIVIYKSNTKQC